MAPSREIYIPHPRGRMNALLRFVRLPLLTLVLVVTSLAGADAACSSGHVAATLANFPPEAVSTPFYWAAEGDGQIVFAVRAMGEECLPTAVTIGYATKDGIATAPQDYAPTSGERVVTTDLGHTGNDRQSVSVPIVADAAVPEPVVESAIIELTGVQGGYLAAPASASLNIVDDDGDQARIALDGTAEYRQLETYALAGVPVFRGGSASGTVSVPFTVEPGPAPAAKLGEDYRAQSGTLTFPPGDRIEMIPITLVNDRDAESPEHLTVALTGAEGAAIEGASRVTFTIRDNEEPGMAESRLHHPHNNGNYRSNDHRIREIHVFTDDRGGLDVSGAEFALRKKMSSGGCQWWTGKRWINKPCAREVWNEMRRYEPDFFYIRLPELPSSKGSIRSYTALSRTIDAAGHREIRFERGRNANTFEVQ